MSWEHLLRVRIFFRLKRTEQSIEKETEKKCGKAKQHWNTCTFRIDVVHNPNVRNRTLGRFATLQHSSSFLVLLHFFQVFCRTKILFLFNDNYFPSFLYFIWVSHLFFDIFSCFQLLFALHSLDFIVDVCRDADRRKIQRERARTWEMKGKNLT